MEEFILIKYLKGSLDADSCTKVEEWALLSEENKKILEDLYVVLFVNDRMDAKNAIDVNKAFNEFKQRNKIFRHSRTLKQVSLWKRVAAAAAIFIFLVLSGTFATLLFLEKDVQSVMVSTKLGERAQIMLPDGSKVWLNAYSNLEYKKSFLSRKRKIKLTGEAYFDVAHNTLFPFIVSNGDSEIKVLGTKFNVRCNDDEDYISTTLMEGAILFLDESAKINIALHPGDELVFDKNTNQIQQKKLTRPDEILGWIEGKLFFENASLGEIARSLERHYNVDIRFNDEKVKQERFNAEFEMADNIYQILSILELTNKFTYEIDKRNVTISSKENK